MKRTVLIGSFIFSALQALCQGDCATFVQLCTPGPVAGSCTNGTSDSELAGAFDGCLTGESTTQSYWYTLCTSTAGTIRFVINPSGGGNDYDFAVWGPNSPCPPTSAPLRCSYAAGGGNTGVHSANNAPQTDNSEGGGGNKWVQDINAAANQCFVILINNYGGGSNNFSITNSGTAGLVCSALPIEYVEWDAKACGRNVCTKWTTATEIDNDFFTVERSADAVNFEIAGTRNGAGNSSSVRHYTFVDHNPFPGLSYYRLKQTNFDGSASYAEVRTVDFNASSAADLDFDLFPNPNDGTEINLSLNGNLGDEVRVAVYDAIGREVHSQVFIIDDTKSVYTLHPPVRLGCGIYFVTAASGNMLLNKKMMVD